MIHTTFICDSCKEGITYDGPFFKIKEEAKQDGWKTVKKDGEWKHLCPECQKNN